MPLTPKASNLPLIYHLSKYPKKMRGGGPLRVLPSPPPNGARKVPPPDRFELPKKVPGRFELPKKVLQTFVLPSELQDPLVFSLYSPNY